VNISARAGATAENAEIVGAVSQTVPVLILVHEDIEAPMEAMVSRPEGFHLRPTHHGSHYVRDASFAEDASRISKNPDIVAR